MDNKIYDNIELTIRNTNNFLSTLQQKFMESSFYQSINSALDIGIKAIMPDIIENEVIEIKNLIFENGLIDGIKQTIESVINFGKDAYGITTGNFENIEQLKNIISKDGTLNKISDFLDKGIKFANSVGLIKDSTKEILQSGKNVLINNINSKLTEEMQNQEKCIKELNEYFDKWQEYYEKEDFNNMEATMEKINEYMEKAMPFKNILNTYNQIESIQNLIKNNGQNFNLTQTELELVNALSSS